MIGAGVTTVVAPPVEVGLGVPPTMVLESVVAFKIGAPKTLVALGELTRAFNFLAILANEVGVSFSSFVVVTV